MANKLSKQTADELQRLMESMKSQNSDERINANKRLIDHERAGRIPLEVLLQISKEGSSAQVMYAISALGRNKQPKAVDRLMEMLEQNKRKHPLLLQSIVDALGDAKDKRATERLLKLLDLRLGKTGKLLNKMKKSTGKKNDSQEQSDKDAIHNFIKLPVVRALEHIADDRAAPVLGSLLEDEDTLVRWHTLEVISVTSNLDHIAKLKDMQKNDESPLVQEKASIVMEHLNRVLSKNNAPEDTLMN